MEKDDAIEYLERKNKLKEPIKGYDEKTFTLKKKVPIYREFTEEEEKNIKKTMKRGKIYGDPFVELE